MFEIVLKVQHCISRLILWAPVLQRWPGSPGLCPRGDVLGLGEGDLAVEDLVFGEIIIVILSSNTCCGGWFSGLYFMCIGSYKCWQIFQCIYAAKEMLGRFSGGCDQNFGRPSPSRYWEKVKGTAHQTTGCSTRRVTSHSKLLFSWPPHTTPPGPKPLSQKQTPSCLLPQRMF